MRRSPRLLLPAVLVPALALSACSTTPATPAGTPTDGSGPAGARISIVATTNVYGSIAAAIGGDRVEVTSLISREGQDPHSYEASAQDQLAVSRADVVIANGGGYDPFIDDLLRASGNTSAAVINAVELMEAEAAEDAHDHDHDDHDVDDHLDDHSGHDHGTNEHVWYDFGVIDELAGEIEDILSLLDPASEELFERNHDAFDDALEAIDDRAHALRAQWSGTPVAVTEPVALYLFEDLGLVNRMSAEFTQAIEEGSDVPPLVLQDALAVVRSGIALLAVNAQTASPETAQLEAAATAAGVPIVSLTETLPGDRDYLGWMSDNLAALEAALA